VAKRLIEVFNLNGKPRKRIGGGTPRAKGTKAEILLLTQLTQQGYEVRRTHLSLFPDIIAWTDTDLLLIEVKARSNPKDVTEAVRLFRIGVRAMTSVPNGASMLCYVLSNGAWSAYQWSNGVTTQIEPIVSEGTS
jgi:predicted transcriptional regulator